MTDEITAICQECGKQFQYKLKPGFPRKYCFMCSENKKAEYEGRGTTEPPVDKGTTMAPMPKPNGTAAMYASYAKDVFCKIFDHLVEQQKKANLIEIDDQKIMKSAIELVKQAQEAFE